MFTLTHNLHKLQQQNNLRLSDFLQYCNFYDILRALVVANNLKLIVKSCSHNDFNISDISQCLSSNCIKNIKFSKSAEMVKIQ